MVIAYIRVSTQEQNTKVQKTEILEYAQKNKIIIDEFIEVEISSRKSAELRQIEYLKSLSPDLVICTELSRLGRSMIEILTLVEYFKEHNIKLVLTKQPELSTNEDNALGTLLYSIYSYFAETERELLSQRVKAGIAHAKKSGKRVGRPRGTTGKSKFDRDFDKIKELTELGLSKPKICVYLGYGTPQGLSKYIKRKIA